MNSTRKVQVGISDHETEDVTMIELDRDADYMMVLKSLEATPDTAQRIIKTLRETFGRQIPVLLIGDGEIQFVRVPKEETVPERKPEQELVVVTKTS